jgi:hypothetical protein
MGIETSNQKLGPRCANSNIETQVMWKKQDNRSALRVNSIIKYLNNSDEDEISNNEFKNTIIRY